MKDIQENLLSFLDSEGHPEEDFQQFSDNLNNQQILGNGQYLNEFLQLLSKVSNNHHRTKNFFTKIERILDLLNNDIKQNFSNSSLFNIFMENKRILLYLIQQKLLVVDKHVYSTLNWPDFIDVFQFLQPELMSYVTGDPIDVKPEFEEFRKTGENERHLCQLIREDSIEEFSKYVTQANLSLSTKIIDDSNFETNPFLVTNYHPTLAEYAAFYGSIRIFNFLKRKDVEMKSYLWKFAIHSNNHNMIRILEDLNIEPEDKTYKECYLEAVKCYHNNIAEYIRQNYLENQEIENSELFSLYNFEYLPDDLYNESNFTLLCKYNYKHLVKILLDDKSSNININPTKI